MPAPATITIDWGEQALAPDERRLWLPSWVVAADGEEGDFLYDGPGGAVTTHEVPAGALGIRFRWAPPAKDDPAGLRRQWNVRRKPYLFAEEPVGTVSALAVCGLENPA